jgi:HK97 gp10 family phage protein
VAVKFQGLDGIVDAMDTMLAKAESTEAVGTACALVEAAAKKKAPKDNGALRRSIASEVQKEGGDIVGVVYTPLEYAPYVEYGTGLFAEDGNGRKDVPWHYKDDKGEWHTTSGQKPQPFLRPALEENREQITRLLREGLTSD